MLKLVRLDEVSFGILKLCDDFSGILRLGC